jgi:hypothetical protein
MATFQIRILVQVRNRDEDKSRGHKEWRDEYVRFEVDAKNVDESLTGFRHQLQNLANDF